MVASNQIIEIPIVNGSSPKQAKAVPLTLDFSVATGQAVQLIDLTNAQQRGVIDSVQSIFLDTSQMTQAVSVVVQGSNMIIVAEPNTQGFYPVLCPPPLRFTFASTLGAGSLRVYLVNVNMPTSKWPTTASGTSGTQPVQDVAAENSLATLAGAVSAGKVLVTDTSAEASLTTLAGAVSAGKILVTDTSAEASLTTLAGAVSAGKVLVTDTSAEASLTTLAGAVSAGKVLVTDTSAEASLTTLAGAVSNARVQVGQVGSGSNPYPIFLPTKTLGNVYTAASNTLFSGSPYFYLSGVNFTIQPNSTVGTASQMAITLSEVGAGVVAIWYIYVPSTQPSFTVVTAVQCSTPPGWFYLSKVSSSNLTLTFSQAFTYGGVILNLSYGFTSLAGT